MDRSYFCNVVNICLILSILFPAASAAGSTCYSPSGLKTTAQACNTTAQVSTCCEPGFACLSNGLCTPGPDNTEVLPFKYFKSGCTDREWGEGCPQFCAGRM